MGGKIANRCIFYNLQGESTMTKLLWINPPPVTVAVAMHLNRNQVSYSKTRWIASEIFETAVGNVSITAHALIPLFATILQ